ncbi:hypothetical protein BG74_08635 [Sodalis-like endosymbiont of Proechinophthirus fluctus]|uniref:hypothetical protein n=1 Tax=Sodalis-like endosymbiont of Proechinophthirus fluctus TaxID=1462730 RepID=UPI0007A8BDD8|nr:hypothetical protein [Sodalis-like endosymbiont of Proechinophthirus fluctus]KYP95603.1 hypothetical protein BG74_08635 [Sodalis-like endosymbiont of Proechinophthirus fluctus]
MVANKPRLLSTIPNLTGVKFHAVNKKNRTQDERKRVAKLEHNQALSTLNKVAQRHHHRLVETGRPG